MKRLCCVIIYNSNSIVRSACMQPPPDTPAHTGPRARIKAACRIQPLKQTRTAPAAANPCRPVRPHKHPPGSRASTAGKARPQKLCPKREAAVCLKNQTAGSRLSPTARLHPQQDRPGHAARNAIHASPRHDLHLAQTRARPRRARACVRCAAPGRVCAGRRRTVTAQAAQCARRRERFGGARAGRAVRACLRL